VAARSRGWIARGGRALLAASTIGLACLGYSWLTLPDVRALRTEAPVTTAFMRLRGDEARRAGRAWRPARRWMPASRISPLLKRAVLVAEDAAFWDHEGVDYDELRASFETYWSRGGAMRGGSTITQQLAKNLYLSPTRNPYRKVVELMIARRLEAELSKSRIFELYLNLIEWGDGIWGADAAARAYFGRPASDLSAEQAALLAGAIINPRVYSPRHPNARLLRRQRIILRRMGPAATPGPTIEPRVVEPRVPEPEDEPVLPDDPQLPPAGPIVN
jgi:monofunctional biosynthetic peptidoglycan transglycosylase